MVNSGNANFDTTWKSLGVFQLVSNLDVNWREASEQLFLSFIFVKFYIINNRKYGVVVEGQTMDLEFEGSSPGHASFEKVINFSYLASFCLT